MVRGKIPAVKSQQNGCHLPGNLAIRRGNAILSAGGLAWVFLLGGCASPQTFVAPRAQSGALSCSVPIPSREVLLGVAMSGGGSRAALFGAAGLEALGAMPTSTQQSVLEQVAYVSSVSGGSIAASYYALKKPTHEVPMLTPEGTMTDAYRAFFTTYRAEVSQSIGPEVFWRQMSKFRWTSPALGAVSLHEILRERLLGDATVMDIAQREANGDSPGLIINTTLYNNGRRFAIAGHSSEDFRYNFAKELQETLARQGNPAQIPPGLLERWQQLLPITPHELHMDVCRTPLSAAVSGSASFPPVIGPITFQVDGDPTYWHAGDGGLYENQGAETILFMFLKQLQEKKARRALILAFDSSFPFAVGDTQLNQRAEPFGLFSFDFSRIPSIMEERATTYRGMLLRTLQMLGVFPNEQTIQVILLRHMDAEWRPDMSDLPADCQDETPKLQFPEEVRQRLSEIPTRLRIMSECDRALLTVSAAKVVTQNRTKILEFLEEPQPVQRP
jgi:hypothetical protein